VNNIRLFLFCALLCLSVSGCRKPSTNVVSVRLKNMLQSYDCAEWEQLLEQSSDMLKQFPENTSALIFRSLAADQLGKRDLALDSALAATRLDPENFMAQYTLGRLYASDPKTLSDAGTPLLNALKLKKGDRNTLILLVNISAQMHSVRLLNYLNELAEADKGIANDPEYLNLTGIAYAERRNTKEAANSFFAAYRKDPNSLYIVLNTAVFVDTYYKMPKKAVPFYLRYLKLADQKPELQDQCTAVRRRLKSIR